jgi:gas vesicle protein
MIRSRNRWSQLVSAFAIGVGAGAALGVLFAPQSGDDTREYLRDTAQGTLDDAVSAGKTAVRRARKNVNDVRDFVNDVADTAENAYREARSATS